MTVHRTALCLASLAAVSALAMSACSSNVTEAEPASTSSEELSGPPEATTTTTTTDDPIPTSTVDVPAGVIGSGCTHYATTVPNGAGSLLGMGADPVGIALSNSPQLTTFAGAFSGRLNSEVNLFDTLNKGQYTVFAPTDDAFARLDPAIIDKFKNDSTELAAVLKYHVLNTDLEPSAVLGEHKTMQGQSLTVSGGGDNLHVNNAGVVCGAIKTANATVYLIDTVLMPPPPAAPTPSTSGTTTPTTSLDPESHPDPYADPNATSATTTTPTTPTTTTTPTS